MASHNRSTKKFVIASLPVLLGTVMILASVNRFTQTVSVGAGAAQTAYHTSKDLEQQRIYTEYYEKSRAEEEKNRRHHPGCGGGGGGRMHLCHRFRHGRLHPPAQLLLWRHRDQAHLRDGIPLWADRLRLFSGPDRADCERCFGLCGNS